jgi:hypothetical protein
MESGVGFFFTPKSIVLSKNFLELERLRYWRKLKIDGAQNGFWNMSMGKNCHQKST